MNWTPKQINDLSAIIEEHLAKNSNKIPYSNQMALLYLLNMIKLFKDSNEEMLRKILDLKKISDSFGIPTEYSELYDILYGNYEDLPIYINIPGFGCIAQWRLSFIGS